MQRAAVSIELRRELIRLLGAQEARVFLMRLGFLSGQADARFVRAELAEPRHRRRVHGRHAPAHVQRCRARRDGLQRIRLPQEAARRPNSSGTTASRPPSSGANRPAAEPVCWTQLGYASGYASEFFDTLIVYKEVECAAQGHSIAGWSASLPTSGARATPRSFCFASASSASRTRPPPAPAQGRRPTGRTRAVRARPPDASLPSGRPGPDGADGAAGPDNGRARFRPQPLGALYPSRLRSRGR